MDNQVLGQLTPGQAGRIVEELRDEGKQVVLLGDGINDVRPYFEDKDGDGINDSTIDNDKDGVNDITGMPTTKQDELFIDEDGDGINDLYFLKERKNFKFKRYEKEIERFKRYRIEKKRKGKGK